MCATHCSIKKVMILSVINQSQRELLSGIYLHRQSVVQDSAVQCSGA